jgi:hypothetical protein
VSKVGRVARSLRRGLFFAPEFWGTGRCFACLVACSRNAAMPALTFLAVVGLALIALLFVADATLEPGSPAIVTSQRSGLPEAQYHNATRTLTDTSAPEPDMTSQAVLAAQPKSAQDALAKTGFRSACGAGQSAKRQARHLPPTEFRPARQFSDQFFSPRRLGLEFHNKAHLTLCERSVRTIDDVACAGQHGSFEIVLCVSRYCALLQCLSPSATRT